MQSIHCDIDGFLAPSADGDVANGTREIASRQESRGRFRERLDVSFLLLYISISLVKREACK